MKIQNAVLLLLAASIWGVAFVAQSVGMDYVGPLTFNSVRCLLGGAVLLPCIWFFQRKRARSRTAVSIPGARRTLVLGGICCGVVLCLASNFQQVGIQYTTVGKAGFITSCYIVIVPILGLFLHKKCGALIVGAVALSLAGLYLLCMTGSGLSVNRGDVLMLVSAVLFAVHIMLIDYFSPAVDGVRMSCIQFFVCGGLSAIGMFLFETPKIGQILSAWAPILYAGVLSCGVGYTLQIIGQRGMNPTVASLILSLESSIAVLAGWAILNQKLTVRELSGCVLMFLAIVLAQAPVGRKAASPAREGCAPSGR